VDWYFKRELPQHFLIFQGTILFLFVIATLVWSWYLLAKPPDMPRGLADFWRRFQTPDPRHSKLWKPALAYLAVWMIPVYLSFAWYPNDTPQLIFMVAGFILAPFYCMMVLRTVYADREWPDLSLAEPAVSPAGRPFSVWLLAVGCLLVGLWLMLAGAFELAMLLWRSFIH
jgi:hypothetical protein